MTILFLQKKKAPKKDKKAVQNTSKKVAKKPRRRGVVYLGHIPEGFFEDELRGYFSQFGKVLRVKVSRSPKVSVVKKVLFTSCFIRLKVCSTFRLEGVKGMPL